MKLTVKLFANFRNDRFKIKEFDLPDDTSCGDVALLLGIELEDLGVIMINGRHAQVLQRLQPGQTLSLFPLVGGG